MIEQKTHTLYNKIGFDKKSSMYWGKELANMALNISFNIVASERAGTCGTTAALFPIACYAEDLSSYSVAWHWHEGV